MLEDYPEVDVVMGTDCLASLLDTGEDYFEDVRWTLSEGWNSGAPPAAATPSPRSALRTRALRVNAPAAEPSLWDSAVLWGRLRSHRSHATLKEDFPVPTPYSYSMYERKPNKLAHCTLNSITWRVDWAYPRMLACEAAVHEDVGGATRLQAC